MLLLAYGSIVAAYVFTIVEGFWLPDVMNVLEHAAYACAGVLAFFTMLAYSRRAGRVSGE